MGCSCFTYLGSGVFVEGVVPGVCWESGRLRLTFALPFAGVTPFNCPSRANSRRTRAASIAFAATCKANRTLMTRCFKNHTNGLPQLICRRHRRHSTKLKMPKMKQIAAIMAFIDPSLPAHCPHRGPHTAPQNTAPGATRHFHAFSRVFTRGPLNVDGPLIFYIRAFSRVGGGLYRGFTGLITGDFDANIRTFS